MHLRLEVYRHVDEVVVGKVHVLAELLFDLDIMERIVRVSLALRLRSAVAFETPTGEDAAWSCVYSLMGSSIGRTNNRVPSGRGEGAALLLQRQFECDYI